MSNVFVIAEAGVNHNGSLSIAKCMVDAAARAGADAVKFQTFKAGSLVIKNAPKAEYQQKTSRAAETQFEMIRKLELNEAAHYALKEHCLKKNILFMSSPFDIDGIRLLQKIGVPAYKIPSGEITNLPYLRALGGLRKKIILSTGMSTMPEIRKALSILTGAGTKPDSITLLHCTSEYPAPASEANLKAMHTLKKAFRVNVGYSDHTEGIEVALAAAALGATVIEKHFTLDTTMPGPDHKASIGPAELCSMVKAIRNIEAALGDGIKRVSGSELKNRAIVRKSIVAARDIEKGERLSEQNLAVKRPGSGISPMFWDSAIGKKASKNFKKDEMISL